MIRAVSYGGGVQSTALLVLAARGEIDFPCFLFANTGDNSENPDTLDYVRNVAVPYGKEHGIEVHELRREWRDGRNQTLFDQLSNPRLRGVGIPARFETTGAPAGRACTQSYKIDVVAKWMKQHGATKTAPGLVALGISLDELGRASTANQQQHYTKCFPLIEMRLDRAACQAIIQRAGLVVPPKSSCFFCPWHTLERWREIRDQQPELYQKSVQLEASMSERFAREGKGRLFFSDTLRPLPDAVGDATQFSLFGDGDACESGYCMV